MNNPQETHKHYIDAIAAQQAKHSANELPWFSNIRDAAAQQFTQNGFPTVKHEAWKYTRLNEFLKTPYSISAPSVATDVTTIARAKTLLLQYPLANMAHHYFVFINGHYCKALSTQDLPNNLLIDTLTTCITQQPALLANYWQSHDAACDNAHGFASLNTALMQDGAVIRIKRNTPLSEPIHLLYLNIDNGIPHANYFRNLIIAEENSHAHIIETYLGESGAPTYFTNTMTDISLHSNAHCYHYKWISENDKAFHVGTVNVDQAQDSHFYSYSNVFGGKLVRSDTNIKLQGKGAACELNGLYLGANNQHIDHHTCIEHVVPHGMSREFYKGILTDKARGVFNGRVHVHPDAQHTDSEQHNKNLLLSKTAEIDTKPELEIYADDVKCAHGATVGNLDEQALFYLRSRGIDPQSAKALLTFAFANEIIEKIPHAQLRKALETKTLEWLSTV